jgi:hypothetical protein
MEEQKIAIAMHGPVESYAARVLSAQRILELAKVYFFTLPRNLQNRLNC